MVSIGSRTHLFLGLDLDGVLLDLDHELLGLGGRLDELGLQGGQLVLHDGHLRRGEVQLVQPVQVAVLHLEDVVSLHAQQALEREDQLQVRCRSHVVVTTQHAIVSGTIYCESQ